MKLSVLLDKLRQAPLIASVQATKGPLDHEDTLQRLAKASLQEGVGVVRLEGVKAVRRLMPGLGVPIIGLLKRSYPDSEVYITPTAQDVDSMLDMGVHVLAMDGTLRPRPKGHELKALIERAHRRKTLVMADCDSLESAMHAASLGADIIGTTLAGYTDARPMTTGPDLELLREIVRAVDVPVIAEGRYSQRWEVDAALRIGAVAVTVGGALNDPVKQTRALWPSALPQERTTDDAPGT
ncbi:N-acetylmannosamine-6-phosphate 2-epimerase, partial [bacterium]